MPPDAPEHSPQRLVRTHRTRLSAIALAFLAIGIAWSMQAAVPTAEPPQVVLRDPWREIASFTYAVPVEHAGAGDEPGTVLPMGEPGYFTTLSPRVHVAFAWQIEDAREPRIHAAANLTALLRATVSGGREAWRAEVPIAETVWSGQAGEDVRVEGVVDVERILQRLDGEAPDSATRSVTIVATVRYASSALGANEQVARYELPIRAAAPLYVLPDASAASFARDHATREMVAAPATRGASDWLLDASGGATLALIGLALLVLARRPSREGGGDA